MVLGWDFVTNLGISESKMKIFQSVLKKGSNVQQNWKKNSIIGGGRGGGQARHGNFHHVFTFWLRQGALETLNEIATPFS